MNDYTAFPLKLIPFYFIKTFQISFLCSDHHNTLSPPHLHYLWDDGQGITNFEVLRKTVVKYIFCILGQFRLTSENGWHLGSQRTCSPDELKTRKEGRMILLYAQGGIQKDLQWSSIIPLLVYNELLEWLPVSRVDIVSRKRFKLQ